jgi:hypothetical protein
MRSATTRLVLAAAASGVLVTSAFIASGAEADAPDSAAAIRAATAKFHDPQVAIDAGYIPTDVCVQSPAGVMGQHWLNPALFGPIDLRKPAVLIYQPSDDGPKLVAVEYFKVDEDQNLATDADRPSLLGHAFDGPMLGHEPGMPIHYDLHAWVWQHNPAGMFAQFNPSGSC